MAYYGQQPQMYQQGPHQHGQPMYQQGPPHMMQQQQHAYQNMAPSQAYGDYGNFYQQNVFSVQAWQAFQMGSQDDLWQVFNAEMSTNQTNLEKQALQAEDLCRVLNNCQHIRRHFGINWSRELCSIMLAMLDRSQDGFMQWQEFMELQQCLVAWHRIFSQFDHDRSGFIEPAELLNITRNSFRYNLSPDCITTLLKRYSRVVPRVPGAPPQCLIAFDDFVSVCVRLRAYTDAFRKRDGLQHGTETGNTTFTYDDFLRCVMCL